MKINSVIGLTLLMFICINKSYAQDKYSNLQMIQKIDSVSKVKNIKTGIVKILFVTNRFDKTDTDKKSLTKASKFSFDGQFLLIEDKYFNISKLLYFYVKDDNIEFFFQGY